MVSDGDIHSIPPFDGLQDFPHRGIVKMESAFRPGSITYNIRSIVSRAESALDCNLRAFFESEYVIFRCQNLYGPPQQSDLHFLLGRIAGQVECRACDFDSRSGRRADIERVCRVCLDLEIALPFQRHFPVPFLEIIGHQKFAAAVQPYRRRVRKSDTAPDSVRDSIDIGRLGSESQRIHRLGSGERPDEKSGQNDGGGAETPVYGRSSPHAGTEFRNGSQIRLVRYGREDFIIELLQCFLVHIFFHKVPNLTYFTTILQYSAHVP